MTARILDKNGWYEIPNNPLSKAGVFSYRGSSIGRAGDDTMYRVYRPAEELSRPETLNSFRLLPFVIDHAMMGNTDKGAPDHWISTEDKGIDGVVGDRVWFDETDQHLKGNLKIFSKRGDKAIANGKSDISMGYLAEYDWEPGVFNGETYDCVQRNIYGNHAAGVTSGRMGDSVEVLDGISATETLTVTFDEKDFHMPKVNRAWIDAMKAKWFTVPGKKNKAGVIGKSIEAMDEDIATAEANETSLSDVLSFIQEVGPQISAIMAELPMGTDGDDYEDVMDEAGKPVMGDDGKPKRKKKVETKDNDMPTMTMDEIEKLVTTAVAKATAPLTAQIETLKAGQPSEKSVMSNIAARDALAGDLSHFIGTFDHSDKTLQEVAIYGVEKLELPGVEKGQELSTVRAYLHGRAKPRPSHTTQDATDDGKSSVDKFLRGE